MASNPYRFDDEGRYVRPAATGETEPVEAPKPPQVEPVSLILRQSHGMMTGVQWDLLDQILDRFVAIRSQSRRKRKGVCQK